MSGFPTFQIQPHTLAYMFADKTHKSKATEVFTCEDSMDVAALTVSKSSFQLKENI